MLNIYALHVIRYKTDLRFFKNRCPVFVSTVNGRAFIFSSKSISVLLIISEYAKFCLLTWQAMVPCVWVLYLWTHHNEFMYTCPDTKCRCTPLLVIGKHLENSNELFHRNCSLFKTCCCTYVNLNFIVINESPLVLATIIYQLHCLCIVYSLKVTFF